MPHILIPDGEGDVRPNISYADEVDLPDDQTERRDRLMDPIRCGLPLEGYRIVDAPPPALMQPFSDEPRSYTPFTPITLGDSRPSRFRRRLASTFKHLEKNWANVLLVFVPIGIAAPNLGCGDATVFVLNCLAIVPLADVLCRATDDAATFLGEKAGALLNVTMGNATEVVIFHALLQRQYMIVRTSLLGSIIVNILLVLSLNIFTGEIQQRGQVYNIQAARIAAGLLCVTTISLLFPSVLRMSDDNAIQQQNVLSLSRAISIVLMAVYFVYLWTQIKSITTSYEPLIEQERTPRIPAIQGSIELSRRSYHRRTISYPRTQSLSSQAGTFPDFTRYSEFQTLPTPSRLESLSEKLASALDRVKVPWVRKAVPIILLVVSTGLISVCGGYLVSSIDHFVDHSPISKTMVGLVILPIVGNVAEIIAGIMFSWRKQMDMAFAISIGSAIQIGLFVTPLVVLIGWALDREMTLHFTRFEAISLGASTVLFFLLIFDNRCSSVKGACLFSGYLMISIASYFILDVD